jgi:hypothetical protein
MGVTPTNVMSPAGWTAMITNMGASIQWTNPSPLAMGASVTGFMFDSTMTPAQFLGTFPGPGLGMGDPITTATLYIGVPFGNPMGSDPEHKSPRCQQRSSVPRSPARCRLRDRHGPPGACRRNFPQASCLPLTFCSLSSAGAAYAVLGWPLPLGLVLIRLRSSPPFHLTDSVAHPSG